MAEKLSPTIHADAYGTDLAFVHDQGWADFVRLVTFRKVGDAYRRHEEALRQQLYAGTSVAKTLRGIGFRVRTVRSYGEYQFPEKLTVSSPGSPDG